MISLLLFMITFHVDAPSCSDEAIRRVELSSDLVVQARVVEVGPSLGLWSGGYVVAQRVDYEIEGILKGQLQDKRIRVAHYVIGGSLSADQKVARLSPSLFAKGNILVLFLVRDMNSNYISPPESIDDNGIRKFLIRDPNCGALPANGKRFDHIKAVVLGSVSDKVKDK